MAKKRDGLERQSRQLNKKALSQIDWIMSLTLFMFYLIWFFVYLIPIISPPLEQSSSNEIYDNFKAETTWTVTKIPVIFFSNISGPDEIIYAELASEFGKGNTTLITGATGQTSQQDFIIEEGKIFFISNISSGANVYMLINSNSNYTSAQDFGDITSNQTRTIINSKSIKAEFSSSLLTSLQREQDIAISQMSFMINNQPFQTQNATFSSTNMSAKYTASSEKADISTYLFSKNYRLLMFLTEKGIANTKSNITISAVMRPYPYYYSNFDFKGDMNYQSSDCKETFYDSISFYGNTSGTTFLLPSYSKITFCTDTDKFTLNITMNLTNSTIQIIPFTGNYSNALKYKSAYSAETGMKDIMTGLSLEKLQILSSSNYNTKKSRWNYKGNGEFSITVTNSTGVPIVSFGKEPSETVNTYVNEKNWWMLDKDGTQETAVVNIRVW
ncbi:MAG: hypothetical protein Q8O89_07170 [Nanoarchaeota archaeon]|nr:hypothetical protein [Nanoarchaeota archaeon]